MARLRLRANGPTRPMALKVGDEYIGSPFSPTIEVEDIEGGHRVTTQHRAVTGMVTQHFDVMHGIDVSIEVTDSDDGHTVTLTGVDGPHDIFVPNYAAEELSRSEAEALRVAAEKARALAEESRSTAEEAREEAESLRVSESARAVQAADNAAASATEAERSVREAWAAGEFDGISPSAIAQRTGNGARMTVTDRDGTTSADILDAGFGTPTATVTQTIGRASVTVTATGPNTAKAFHFAFSGIKGEKGDTGDATKEGSVTSKELADGAVTRSKIADGVIATLTAEQIDVMFEVANVNEEESNEP